MAQDRGSGSSRLERFKAFNQAMSKEIREHKSTFVVYVVLRGLVLAALVLQFLNGNYENVLLCLLVLALLLVPSIVQVCFRIDLPSTLEVIMLLFVFAAEILGEMNSLYTIFPFWDTVLHTLNGFLAAAIGFALVDLLNRSSARFNLSPIYLALVAFCFSMTIGVLWEFFEFSMDQLLGWDMQKDTIVHAIHTVMLDPTGSQQVVSIDGITSTIVNGRDLGLGGYLDIGLIDTMEDLFVNFIGALVFSIFGFLYVKNRGKGRFLGRFIPRRREDEED